MEEITQGHIVVTDIEVYVKHFWLILVLLYL